MKIRSGFVSNSSSSSFVMIGCEVVRKDLKKLWDKLKTEENKEENWEDDIYDLLYESDWLYDGERDRPILGRKLAGQDTDTYQLDNASYTVEKVQKIMKEVEDVIGKEPKLFMGTRSC